MIPSIAAVQRLNSYEAAGLGASDYRGRVDLAVLDRLETERRLERMKAAGEILRLAVEGFDADEIALRRGMTARMVRTRLRWIRECMWGRM